MDGILSSRQAAGGSGQTAGGRRQEAGGGFRYPESRRKKAEGSGPVPSPPQAGGQSVAQGEAKRSPGNVRFFKYSKARHNGGRQKDFASLSPAHKTRAGF